MYYSNDFVIFGRSLYCVLRPITVFVVFTCSCTVWPNTVLYFVICYCLSFQEDRHCFGPCFSVLCIFDCIVYLLYCDCMLFMFREMRSRDSVFPSVHTWTATTHSSPNYRSLSSTTWWHHCAMHLGLQDCCREHGSLTPCIETVRINSDTK